MNDQSKSISGQPSAALLQSENACGLSVLREAVGRRMNLTPDRSAEEFADANEELSYELNRVESVMCDILRYEPGTCGPTLGYIKERVLALDTEPEPGQAEATPGSSSSSTDVSPAGSSDGDQTRAGTPSHKKHGEGLL